LAVKVLPCTLPALDSTDRFLAALIDYLHSLRRHDPTSCMVLSYRSGKRGRDQLRYN